MAYVIDASLTLAWCFADESTAATEALRDRLREERALAPALWVLETTNALTSAVRRGRITPAQASRLSTLLAALPIDVDATAPDRSVLFELAQRHALSVYDASYLHLAVRSGLPLASLDERLRAAAKDAGVDILPA
jgi:predicted nucleic acid-binding protein